MSQFIATHKVIPQNQTILQTISFSILSALGWHIDVNLPNEKKFIIVGAPHTSNWDFVYFLLLMYSIRIKLHWIGKDTLFRWPVGGIMKRIGGIPVNRRSNNNFVNQIVESFQRYDELMIVITPEGTRSKTPYWKTGFYYIAVGAQVPIAMGFIDYQHKHIGIDRSFLPSGDIQADFEIIREFYADKTGKYPDEQGEIKIKPRQE
jgi:1-acyl-sn-glycerol-3-phosphate acyltransferase